jgi:hypothetical protein
MIHSTVTCVLLILLRFLCAHPTELNVAVRRRSLENLFDRVDSSRKTAIPSTINDNFLEQVNKNSEIQTPINRDDEDDVNVVNTRRRLGVGIMSGKTKSNKKKISNHVIIDDSIDVFFHQVVMSMDTTEVSLHDRIVSYPILFVSLSLIMRFNVVCSRDGLHSSLQTVQYR